MESKTLTMMVKRFFPFLLVMSFSLHIYAALPKSLGDFKKQNDVRTRRPLSAVKSFLLALLVYEKNPTLGRQMLRETLHHSCLVYHKEKKKYIISPVWNVRLRMLERPGGKKLIRSYFKSATEANHFHPNTQKPLKVNFVYPKNKMTLKWAEIYIFSTADPRPRKIRLLPEYRDHKFRWRITNQSSDVFLPLPVTAK